MILICAADCWKWSVAPLTDKTLKIYQVYIFQVPRIPWVRSDPDGRNVPLCSPSSSQLLCNALVFTTWPSVDTMAYSLH